MKSLLSHLIKAGLMTSLVFCLNSAYSFTSSYKDGCRSSCQHCIDEFAPSSCDGHQSFYTQPQYRCLTEYSYKKGHNSAKVQACTLVSYSHKGCCH